MIFVKMIWMLYVGCPVRTAIRHVWYDRFEKELLSFDNTWQVLQAKCFSTGQPGGSAVTPTDGPTESIREQANVPQATCNEDVSCTVQTLEIGDLEATLTSTGSLLEIDTALEPYEGSAIDRTWRLSMVSFIIGALPQAVKVFGMRGIPLTQTLVAFLVVSFLVPELLRTVAGTAGAVDLSPRPIVTKAKSTFVELELYALCASIIFTSIIVSYCVFVPLFNASTSYSSHPELSTTIRNVVGLYTIAIGITLPIALFVRNISYNSWTMTKIISGFTAILPGRVCQIWISTRSSFATRVSVLLAFNPPLSPASFEFAILCLVSSIPQVLLFWLCGYSSNDTLALSSESVLRTVTPYLVLFATVYAVWGIPALLLLPYLFFRLRCMGPFSRYPRKLFGLDGTVSEFCAGAFVMTNILSLLMGYSFLWYEVGSMCTTWKPDWADALG
jgi:hypothetical protein